MSSVASKLNDTTEKNMAPKDGTGAERNARYKRIGKASVKAQEHVGGDCAGGQAQGQRLHVGAGKERTAEEKGLIEEAN
jgi:hypothetical protein